MCVRANRLAKEGSTGVIPLKAAEDVVEGDDPYIVGLMIAFLYENDYQPNIEPPLSSLELEENCGASGGNIEPVPSPSMCEEALVNFEPDHVMADDGWKPPKKNKKGKNKKTGSTKKDVSNEKISSGASPKCSLAVHAKLFALGSKYDIPHLQTRSLAKFKAATQQPWSTDEFIESIPIAFNTAPDHDGLRTAIKAIIIEYSEEFTDDSAFQTAVADIEDLAFELFKLQTHHRRGQRICLECNSVYQSVCVLRGCPVDNFYENHTCDSRGFCANCSK